MLYYEGLGAWEDGFCVDEFRGTEQGHIFSGEFQKYNLHFLHRRLYLVFNCYLCAGIKCHGSIEDYIKTEETYYVDDINFNDTNVVSCTGMNKYFRFVVVRQPEKQSGKIQQSISYSRFVVKAKCCSSSLFL